jgi:hypothetical protein
MDDKQREQVAKAGAMLWNASNLMAQARSIAGRYIGRDLRENISLAQKTVGDWEAELERVLRCEK